MTDDRVLTIDTLMRLLTQAAGAVHGTGTGEAVADTEFSELGYDSLALLETASLVEREFGIRVGDEVTQTSTPGEFLVHVNGIIAAGRPT
jgi:minimal PKS acyl carrier protein